MGNRMLRESLLESDKISVLSDFDFRLWITLILLADDYGVVDARPTIIKGHGFPLRERITLKDISEGLRRLAAGRCVTPYTVGGRPYVQFPNWSDHQRVRNSKHKFPTAEEADAASCGELPQVAASCGESRLEPEPEIEPEHRTLTPRVSAECARFDDFWVVYPRHEAKKDAVKAWKSIKPDGAILATIIADIKDRLAPGGAWYKAERQYIPLPATYLRGARWEDEPSAGAVNEAANTDEPWWKDRPWWEWPLEERRKREQQMMAREGDGG